MILVGCTDGSIEQVFQDGTMLGCDGNYNIDNFREACTAGWNVATAREYFAYGGKTVRPNAERWVDVTWDANGLETSLENWTGHYDCSNGAGWDQVCHSDSCTWLSTWYPADHENEECALTFANFEYGKSYGCHCMDGDPKTTYRGVICVKGKTR